MFGKLFLKAVFHDVWRCTIPWLLCRILVYPIINIDMKLQKDYYVHDYEAFSEEKAPVSKTFTFAQKIHYGKQIIAEEGFFGLFKKWENYVAPFAAVRILEGIICSTLMHFLTDILGLKDAFFIVSLLSFLVLNVIGSLMSKLVKKIFSMPESEKIKWLFDLKKLKFWKYYHIDHLYSHVYRHFQGFTLIIGYWYFKPNVVIESILCLLYEGAEMIALQRLGSVSQFAQIFNQQYDKTIKKIYKKYGIWGLYSGSKHACAIEAALSIIQIPFNYLIASLSEIEETLNRIKTHKSVRGIVICNAEGKIVRNTFAEGRKEEGENIAKTIPPLAIKARNAIRDLDSSNELTFLRLRSRNYEIMVAPDKEFMLIVVQDTKGEKKEGEA